MIPALFTLAFPPTPQLSYTVQPTGMRFTVGKVTKSLVFFSPSIVRVNANLGADYAHNPSFSVNAKPVAVPFRVARKGKTVEVNTASLQILVTADGSLTFRRPNGEVIARESATTPTQITPRTYSGDPTYEVKQTFTMAPNESLYGLGQYNQPYMDYRGKDVLLVQTNIGIVVPFLLSTQRYGILWDIASKGTFKDSGNGATFWGESAPSGVDYYFVAGKDMDGVIQGYRKLTGSAPMFPKAAFGLFMSKERYTTQNQLIEVVINFRKAGFPLDYIVQDWQYWGGADGTWSGMTWDKDRFPDPVGLTRTLHNDLHVKLMNSIWPSVGNDTELAHELDASNLRFEPLHWISKKARIYDAFSPKGREIYFKYIKQGLLDAGVDALWMDGTEVEVGGACHDAGEVERDIKNLGRNAAGDFVRNLNNYSLLTTEGTYEGQRKNGNKRILTLTRSAWPGQQRYAALPWSGDTTASWKTLRDQISGGVNVAMAGLPYWTQDTGGFFVNFPSGTKNPEYRELYNRWNQFAIFNPVYRIHGTSIDREPYRFADIDPEMYDGMRDAANLRYRLLPYIYSLAWMSTADGYTMMRGLPMDFPDDTNVRKTGDAFMFGPAFLVHPITRPIYHAPVPAPGLVPTSAMRSESGQPGLDVTYFRGRTFTDVASKSVDAVIDHTWPEPPLANPPAGLSSIFNFSARWTGKLIAPETGQYELGVEGDDGFRLWLDGKMVVEDWQDAAARYGSTKVTLTKGQEVNVRIDFYQGGGERSIKFCWRTPSELDRLARETPKVNNLESTYLPAGAWFDFWTNERISGGKTVKTECPMNRFPLFVRSGTILPMGPEMQYATEKPDAPLDIRVYPGRDAAFNLYEDDNETYAYEKGQRALIPMRWDNRTGTLTIGARKGSFPGMVPVRQFRVSVIRPGEAPAVNGVVRYSGGRVVLKLGTE